MFSKVLVANRGEIAVRILRTLRKMGVRSVAVFSDVDRHAPHVLQADESVWIGPSPARQSYLDADRLLGAVRQTGAEAVHPGYGFLSENGDFSEACEKEGVAFIGPTPEQLRLFGLKHTAREIAERLAVPLLPGSGLLATMGEATAAAERIGYPVMLKSTAGGGGIGMQLCYTAADLAGKYETVRSLGRNNFKEEGLYLEKFVQNARHIEVQIFGDGRGTVISLGERDCSAQRRNQKVIEETPAPLINSRVREELCETAVKLGEAVAYRSAGTVEFVYDAATSSFYFLEVNTRLQVEHGVTELVAGIDLVEWMVRTAAGDPPELKRHTHIPEGHAIEVRLYAEDPEKAFRPSSGLLTNVNFPEDTRCDHWIASGTEVSPFYDPLLAKLLVHGASRQAALAKLSEALTRTRLDGIETNLDYVSQAVASEAFQEGGVTTKFLDGMPFRSRSFEVIAAGTQTTVQDYPGRLGYWAVGVPPSGPMDSLAFRLANRILGNAEDVSAIEITLSGPTLHFRAATTICLTGASLRALLNDAPLPFWTAVPIAAGDTLKLGGVQGAGCRAYLGFLGGLDVPKYLGSSATFTLGGFGGHGGRALRVGDVLKLLKPGASLPEPHRRYLSPPHYSNEWEVNVISGPHGAPDFFTSEDIDRLFTTEWVVHHNSARTGVRLIGPKPAWARKDGGEAGLHPSNIHDNPYAVGAIDFTGDMPIILGPDGPSLGGFVCPACVIQADLWKIGQLRPGDKIRFCVTSFSEAQAMEKAQEEALAHLTPVSTLRSDAREVPNPVLLKIPERGEAPAIVIRASGSRYLLIEFGEATLDMKLRLYAHSVMHWFEKRSLEGVIDLTPGIRSLQIHFDSQRLERNLLIDCVREAAEELVSVDALQVPSRVVHLPLAWNDSATQLAIEKYQSGVRPDAPWCPSNLEFIRRINGLESIEAVQKIVFAASYLVLGLGDVYLGAPVAAPLDPRHRLITTKYNPARTWTPENAVGIGGAYLCIYGMEGPGGYQFVGRTIQMWNRFVSTRNFPPGKPWLLRFFDQLRFYPVSEAELLAMREDFLHGACEIRTEETVFSLREYTLFLERIAGEAAEFKMRQQAAFEAERDRWDEAGLNVVSPQEEAGGAGGAAFDQEGAGEAILAPLPANVWQVLVEEGAWVGAGDRLAILEAMKMEIPVEAPFSGQVRRVLCAPGKLVGAGQPLFTMEETIQND